jgi:uncharacterized protein (TIGR03435 family)
MRSAILALTLTGLASFPVFTQAPSSQLAPAFDVASVKPNTSGEDRSMFSSPPGGVVTITNMTLRMLIVQAYGIELTIERFSLVGGPEGLLSTRYDITAKPPDGVHPRPQVLLMLRALLAERFKLRTHTETRDVPIYAMTVAREGRLGPEIRQSNHDCAALVAAGGRPTDPKPPRDSKGRGLCWNNFDFGPVRGVRFAGPVASLVTRGAQPYVDRPVIDATGLTGNYEWHVSFTMTPSLESEASSTFTAFQEQLGLKLEPRSGPYEVRVIDSVESPTPN